MYSSYMYVVSKLVSFRQTARLLHMNEEKYDDTWYKEQLNFANSRLREISIRWERKQLDSMVKICEIIRDPKDESFRGLDEIDSFRYSIEKNAKTANFAFLIFYI